MYIARPQFLSFHERDNRWACIVAHRRAGKTVACVCELLTRALATKKQHAKYAYVAPFYNQAKEVAWGYLKQYSLGIAVKVSESELKIELYNGSTIRLYGADNPDSLRGIYLDGIILDEYADMRPSVWGTIIRPMLADRKGWAVFIGTPKGHNAFYDVYKLSREDSDWYSLTLRASESGLISAEELVDARKGMTEDQYLQEFECSFEAAITGAVYGKWMADAERVGRIKTDIYDAALPVHTAWDLGFDDSTSIWWWQLAYNEPRLINYYEASQEDIAHYCDIIKSRGKELGYRYGKHFVPHDANNKLLAAGGRSIAQQAWDLGVKMYVVPATSQQNSIEAARKTIELAWFDSSKCNEGIEALKQYQFEFDEDKKTYKSKPRHDWASHGSDAFEIIGQVWRNPKALEPETKPRFFNDLTANEVFWPKTPTTHGHERI